MKIFLILIFLLVLLNYALCQPTWHIITVDSYDNVGTTCSLALDSMNEPHISYVRVYDPQADWYDLKYAVYNGNTWDIAVILHTAFTYDTSIALTSDNIPNISFTDYGYQKYATLNGTTWQISTIDQYRRFSAITVDSQNHPHIAYQQTELDDFKYAYFDGSNWQLQTIDPMYASGQGDNNSITTDSQNNPHISYCQDAIGQLRYAHKVISSWVIEYPDTLQGSTGLSTSICLDSQDRPCISHCNPLRYCSKATGTWQVQQVDTNVGGTSLALDSNGYPFIAYRKLVPTPGLYMANWDGSTWQLETVDPSSNTGLFCSLKLDSADKPHIAYMLSGTYQDLMYAWYGDGSLGVDLQSFTAQPAPNSIKLCWQAQNIGPALLAGFNLYRIDLSRDPDKKYVQLNQNLIIGNSPYTFLDSRIESGVNYQYRLWATYTDSSREEVGTNECSNDSIQPAAFSLISVYPNPAKSSLTCRLSLSQPSQVNLTLYDISGRLVLAKRYALPTGEQDIALSLGKLAKGVYTVQVESSGAVESKRIVVLR